jgi:hypothetical protein
MHDLKLNDKQIIQKLSRDFANKESIQVAGHHEKIHEFPWEYVK